MAEVIRADFSGGGAGTRLPAVATLSLSPVPGDPRTNLPAAEDAIRETVGREPSTRWIVLPELFTCGYSSLGSVHRHAEDAAQGPSARFFSALARELNIFVAYGFPEKVAGSVAGVFDSANLVGPEGVVATYRKRNLVGTTAERRVFAAGAELPVVEAGGMRVALVVCWDLGFPEVAREAAAGGAGLILAPAAWRHPWGPQYELSCAARALDSGVYLASANQLGDYPEARFDAPGRVYGPDGQRACRTAGAANVGRVDLTAPARWRAFYGDTLAGGEEEPMEICS